MTEEGIHRTSELLSLDKVNSDKRDKFSQVFISAEHTFYCGAGSIIEVKSERGSMKIISSSFTKYMVSN